MKNNKNNNIIELNDILTITYRVKPEDQEVIKFIDKELKITIGKNQLFKGLDELLIGKNSLENKGKIEIDNFVISNDSDFLPNQKVKLGIKVISHEKQIEGDNLNSKSKEAENKKAQLEIKELREQNLKLLEKIKKLELEKKQSILTFQLKAEEMTKKAQSEVSKIKEEIKSRAKEEIKDSKQFAIQKFAEELTSPLDNLYKSIQFGSNSENEMVSAYVKGFNLLLGQIFAVLENNGISIIEPLIGDDYNPEFHHAYDLEESKEWEKDKIIKIISRGYSLNGRVIKPALVIVSK